MLPPRRGVAPRGEQVRGTSDIAAVRRIEAMPRGTRKESGATKLPAPIPIGDLRRLILGHASARDLRVWAGEIVISEKGVSGFGAREK